MRMGIPLVRVGCGLGGVACGGQVAGGQMILEWRLCVCARAHVLRREGSTG